MLSVRNLEGEEEGLVGIQNLSRNRKINAEKVISLTVIPSKANEHSYKLFEEESIVYFEDEPYVVKKMNEKSVGNTTVKRGDAIHKFYVDLINKQQPKIHNGSITFKRYMEEFVFEGTGIEVVLIDSFAARSFENLGDDNRLALLSKGVERFKAEFELVGNQARFKRQIGVKSDFQFRYGHNIKALNVDVDTSSLATVIRGKGDPELGIEAYYRSDNADYFGELDSPSVNDERFKSNEALLEEMKSRLQDIPEFSLQIDFAELRAAGYPYTVPNEGDSVFVIYEPMNDLEIETRILDIDEVFDKDLKVIKTVVTLANYKKTLAGAMFDRTQKQLKEIVDDDGIIKYSVLDEAVRIATESLQSAQTELLFDNGIIAREKDDPNRLVLFNSKGLGISKNGGQDFTEAITADGFVLSAGAIGRLKANNIQLGPETEFIPGYDPVKNDDSLRDNLRLTSALPTSISLSSDGITASTSKPNAYARLDYRGLYIRGGAIQIDGGLPDNQIEGSKKWNKQGTYIDKDGIYTGKVTANQVSSGVIDTNKIKVQGGSGDNYTKIDGNFFENKGRHRRHWWDYNDINTVRVMIEDGQIRARNDTQNWSLYFNDWGISTFADGSGDDYGQVASGAIEFHSTKYHPSRGLTIFSGARLALETNGGRLYLNPNGANVHVANEYDNYYNITAGGYNNSSSKKEKRDIKLLQDDALSLINSLKIMEYKRLTGGKSTTLDRWQAGIIVEEAPRQFLADGESVDIYTYVNYLARSVQQLSNEITSLKGA